MNGDSEKSSDMPRKSPREVVLSRLSGKNVEVGDFVKVDLFGFGYPDRYYIARLTDVDYQGNCHIAITRDPTGNPIEITVAVSHDNILNKVVVGNPITPEDIEDRRNRP